MNTPERRAGPHPRRCYDWRAGCKAPAIGNPCEQPYVLRKPLERRKRMTQYKLPDLPYDFGALEPHVSGKIMELHHGKHHAGYVKNANATLERLDEARTNEQFDRIPALERSLAFNLSGHILHSIFWRNLSPTGGGEPAGELKAAIERDFSGYPAFKRQLNEVAGSIMGSGWAALVWEPLGERLLITQIYDHQSNLNQSGVPLLVLDAWEHAYYLQYQNRKADFFGSCWNVFNWPDVASRFEAARKLRLDAA
jgi:Fe-Mn family superoxide dismutase